MTDDTMVIALSGLFLALAIVLSLNLTVFAAVCIGSRRGKR